ncbi:hypothetical protein L9F63_009529, partial [Diploptera punctata]
NLERKKDPTSNEANQPTTPASVHKLEITSRFYCLRPVRKRYITQSSIARSINFDRELTPNNLAVRIAYYDFLMERRFH